MLWLIVAISAYFFFALAFLGDKVVLSGSPKPKLYIFYIGILNLLLLFLIPFAEFHFPSYQTLVWIILEAIVYVIGLYTLFVAIEKFEVTRVTTVIGAIQPLLILLFTWLFFKGQIITNGNILAFMLLFLGSILISVQRGFKVKTKSIMLILLSALMFSLDYIFSKFVFLDLQFLEGLIWMRIFSFFLILLFLFSKDLRVDLTTKGNNLNKKTGVIFILTQASGGLATILQNFAIYLAPVAYLALVNSLRGTQYVFVFIVTIFMSYFFPKVIKEDISKKVILQKFFAILLIFIGLAILVNN